MILRLCDAVLRTLWRHSEASREDLARLKLSLTKELTEIQVTKVTDC